MNKTFRIIAVGVVLFVLISGWLVIGHSSSSRAVLAKYKAELRSRGEKLTFAELVQSKSSRQSFPNSNLVSIAAKLGQTKPTVPFWSIEARKFVGPGLARALWQQSVIVPPKKAITWEEFAAAIDAHAPALEELRQLLKASVPDNAMRTNGFFGPSPIPNFIAFRTAALWLVGECEYNMHRGQLAEALQDLESIVALAEGYRDEHLLVSQMIRISAANIGLAATWDALQSTQWNEPQLASLQRAWEAVDLFDRLETGFIGERAAGEQFWDISRSSGSQAKQLMQALRRGSGNSLGGSVNGLFEDYIVVPAYNVTSINDDELLYLKLMQSTLETIRAVKLNEPWPKAKAGFDKQIAKMMRLAGTPQKFHYLRTLTAFPNYPRTLPTALRAETERQMTVIAIALQRYQLVRGRTAPSLEALVPEFLKSVPIDRMSSLPFRYKVTADKDFLLYSVGEDGIDDGGDATPGKSLWDGHDAVWPRADHGQNPEQ